MYCSILFFGGLPALVRHTFWCMCLVLRATSCRRKVFHIGVVFGIYIKKGPARSCVAIWLGVRCARQGTTVAAYNTNRRIPAAIRKQVGNYSWRVVVSPALFLWQAREQGTTSLRAGAKAKATAGRPRIRGRVPAAAAAATRSTRRGQEGSADGGHDGGGAQPQPHYRTETAHQRAVQVRFGKNAVFFQSDA